MSDQEAQPHPEAVAATARASVVQRPDTAWAAYGITPAEQATWVAAGIPTDRAHWAAMCRDTTRRPDPSVHITPARLRAPLSTTSSETALEALARGSNIVRIQARMVGRSLDRFVPEQLVIAAAEGHASCYIRAKDLHRQLSKSLIADDPHRVPEAARLLAEMAEVVRPLWAARIRLATEITDYRSGRAPGPLLSAFARAHGVYATGPVLDELTTGVVGDLAVLRDGAQVAQLLGQAATEGSWLFMTPDAVAESAGYRHGVGAYRDDIDRRPPDRLALAFLAAGEVDDDRIPARVVAWSNDGDTLTAALIPRGKLSGTLINKPVRTLLETWRPGEPDAVDGAVRHVHLLTDFAQRERPSSERAAPTAVRSRAGGERSVLVYRSVRSVGGVHTGPRARPDHRWTVRGHWRRQWYPSENAHKVIWIAEHESGPADLPLIDVEHVRVIT